ncbi:MAG: KGGVGR-motif variant AAA ATPase [Acidobacteriota bacterium]
MTFDAVIPELAKLMRENRAEIEPLLPVVINRDLNGRIRFVVSEAATESADAFSALKRVAEEVRKDLGPHSYPAPQAILLEPDIEAMIGSETTYVIPDLERVYVIDRLATEGSWSSITSQTQGAPRIVFFAIKGGVGRSTALAATAWTLAEAGKRVLVIDLDLESPGISTSMLPMDRRPAYGVVDWLVEDLVGNGEAVVQSMTSSSPLSRNGEILIVPSHGRDPGEYISKLGRVWMPKVDSAGIRERWSGRLNRLLDGLEERWSPDVILVDSRSGIDEVSSACLTEISASMILLFAVDGDQTWSGYRILFEHWRRTDVVTKIRERLQIVGAMIPEVGAEDYFAGMRENSWDLFSQELYDEVPAGAIPVEGEIWSFDKDDRSAPHFPWAIRWHRGFAALQSLYGGLERIDPVEIQSIFGNMTENIASFVEGTRGRL